MSEHDVDLTIFSDEELAQLLQAMETQNNPLYGLIPQDPDLLDFTNKQQTSYGKLEDILGSYFTRGAAGAGAWDPEAFTPTVEREYVERPGERILQYYLQNPYSLEGMIASELAAPNGTVSTARAQIAKILDPNIEGHDPALAANILQMMGTTTDKNTMEQVPNWSFFEKKASDIENAIISDPSAQGLQVDEFGRYYRETSTPSEAAQWFADQGLSTPATQYTAPFLMGADWRNAGPTSNPLDYRAMMEEVLFPGSAPNSEYTLAELRRQSEIQPEIFEPMVFLPEHGNGEPTRNLLAEVPPLPPPVPWEEALADGTLMGGSLMDQANAEFARVNSAGPEAGSRAAGEMVGPARRKTSHPSAGQQRQDRSLHQIGTPLSAGQPTRPASDTGRPGPGRLNNETGEWISWDTPNYRAYQDASAQARRMRRQRFGDDFYFAAGQANALREGGRSPLRDELMRARMQAQLMGL